MYTECGLKNVLITEQTWPRLVLDLLELPLSELVLSNAFKSRPALMFGTAAVVAAVVVDAAVVGVVDVVGEMDLSKGVDETEEKLLPELPREPSGDEIRLARDNERSLEKTVTWFELSLKQKQWQCRQTVPFSGQAFF